jgi:hypothetical protein
MSTDLIILGLAAILGAFVIGLAFGGYFGAMHERARWNILILKGAIPVASRPSPKRDPASVLGLPEFARPRPWRSH